MDAVLRYLLVILLFSGVNACFKLSNHAQKVALDCGVSTREAEEHDYLRLLGPNEQPLLTTAGVRVRLVRTRTQEEIALPLTRNACIALPEDSGTILVSQNEPRAGLAFVYSPSLWGFQNPTLSLLASPQLTATAQCPQEGFFASNDIQAPFQFTIQGSLKPTRIHIVARHAATQAEIVLFSKPFGQELLNADTALNINILPEGVYTLEARLTDLGDGFDARDRNLSPGRSCLLTVIRSRPLLSRAFPPLPSGSQLPAFDLGAKLPWAVTDFNQELYVCSEAHAPGAAEAVCAPQGTCRNQEAFRKVLSIETKEPGLFDYYVFVKDRAGNTSPLDCQTLAVSEREPMLKVEWKKSRWNTDSGEQIELPYAALEAEATLSHPIISQDELKNNLECRVDFLLQGRDGLRGDKVTCLSGRCQGRSLGDFTPCSPSLRFDISRAWEQKSLALAQIRLTMRTSDGAGHSASQTLAVWSNASRWPVMPVTSTTLPSISTPWTTLRDRKGQILAFQSDGHNFTLKDDVWTPTSFTGESSPVLQSFTQFTSGEIYADAYQIAPDTNIWVPDGIVHWTGRSWQKEPELENIASQGRCRSVFRSQAAELFCGLAGPDHVIRTLGTKQDGRWKTVPTPLDLTSDFTYHVLQTRDGSLWIFAKGVAYRFSPDARAWQETPVENMSKVEEDRFGNLWLLFDTGMRESTTLQRLTGNSFQRVPLPDTTHPLRDTLKLNGKGELVYGAFRWGPGQSWDPLPLPTVLTGQKTEYYPLFDDRGDIWWLNQIGLVGQLDGEYVHIPLNIHGLSCFDEGNVCGLIHSGSRSLTLTALKLKNFEYSTYTLTLEDLATFDIESLGMPSTKSIGRVWTGADGTTELNFALIDGPAYALREGRWIASPDAWMPNSHDQMHRAPDGTLLSTRGNTVYVSQKLGVWVPANMLNTDEWMPIREPFQNFSGTAFYRMTDAWDVYLVKDSQIQKVPGPQDSRLYVVGSSLWGRGELGLTEYTDFSFQKRRFWSFADLNLNPADVTDIFPTARNGMLLKVRAEGGFRYKLVHGDDGTSEDWDFPFSAPTEAYEVLTRGDGSWIVKTNWDIWLKSKEGWRPLLTGDELEAKGYSRGVESVFLDARDRLWMHKTGTFFRLDLQTAPAPLSP
jgi:hypothetical protein